MMRLSDENFSQEKRETALNNHHSPDKSTYDYASTVHKHGIKNMSENSLG